MEKIGVENYNRYMIKRFGVSNKDIDEWIKEYKDDVKIGAIKWASKSCLKVVNNFLNDIKLRKKYRICEDYKQISDNCFEGKIRNTNHIIKVEKNAITKSNINRNIVIYIDNVKMFECGNQKQAVNWIKNYLETIKDAI